MTDVIMLAAAGLSLGAMYALVALGFAVIYRASQVFNFAHGELLGVGAFSMTSLVGAGLPWPLALLVAMTITGCVAMAVERSVVRPMIGRPVFVTIILTLFVALLLRALMIIIWGVQPRAIASPLGESSLALGGAEIPYQTLTQIVVAMLAMGGFFALLKYSKLGVGMRATSTDQEVALALGIPVGRILGATWFLAGMLAGLAGVFAAMKHAMFGHEATLIIAFRAFPAVIVGGLTSPVGTVIAGFLLGMLEIFAPVYLGKHLGNFGRNIQDVFPYMIMILFLMVRPYGLLGTRDVERL
ncbi:MAG TPA: branched-chain amino acid ABC transporter permease [Kofleriaceae bacterium]